MIAGTCGALFIIVTICIRCAMLWEENGDD